MPDDKEKEQIKRVAAVVVTYNRKALLLQCIKKIQEQQGVACDVLVIDNASKDGTGETLQSMVGEHLQYRNTGENLGGAGGFHYGMRWAVEAGYDLVWIMDDDTLPEPDALSQLLKADALLNGNYGFLSSVVLWTDGHECKMNRQKVKKGYYEYLEFLREGLLLVEQATFVSLLFPKNVICHMGLPIKEYFIWGDDIEYTRRIAVRNDIPSFLVGKSRVVHAMEDNYGSNIATDKVARLNRYLLAYRNEGYTYRQEGILGFGYYTARCIRDSLRVWCCAKDHRFHRNWIILSGFARGLFFTPKEKYIENDKSEA